MYPWVYDMLVRVASVFIIKNLHMYRMTTTRILVRRTSPFALIPTRGSPHAAGLDITSISTETLEPGERRLIHTGLELRGIPEGTYIRVAPRSGLALKGIDVCAGVVDADYRGEICVVLVNNTYPPKEFVCEEGMRVAQLILERIEMADTCEVSEEFVSGTERGIGGFGSTGGN